MSTTFLSDFAQWLFNASAGLHPEKSQSALAERTSGLAADVVGSDPSVLRLSITLVKDPDANVIEHDGLDLATSRAAALLTAQQIAEQIGADLAHDWAAL